MIKFRENRVLELHAKRWAGIECSSIDYSDED